MVHISKLSAVFGIFGFASLAISQPKEPNLYRCRNASYFLDYSLRGSDRIPEYSYFKFDDQTRSGWATGPQVTRQKTVLGTLVSSTFPPSSEQSGFVFSFLVPTVHLQDGQIEQDFDTHLNFTEIRYTSSGYDYVLGPVEVTESVLIHCVAKDVIFQ